MSTIEEDKKKEAALLKLKNILAKIQDCKSRGVAPPAGLMAEAEHLADLFPDPKLMELLKEIVAVEQALVKEIAQRITSSAWMDTKSFKELIALDPCKAAELYFEREEIKKLNKTIDKIDKGELPPVEEFIDYVKVLREEKENRDLLCPALAVEAEKLKLKANDPETEDKPFIKEKLEQAEEYLAKLGKHKVHAAVHNKYREKRRERGLDHDDEVIAREDGKKIVNDVLDVNSLLERAEVFVKDIAAVPEEFIESFVKTKDTEELRAQVEAQKAADLQAAKDKLEQEKAAAAERVRIAKEKEIKIVEVEKNAREMGLAIEDSDEFGEISVNKKSSKQTKIVDPVRAALVKNSKQRTVRSTPAGARRKSSKEQII